jgi:ABC-type transport system involved in multi-copper enzyme maturation permease subunit
MTATTLPRRNLLLRFGVGLERFRSGVMAVGTKELRGRMRGRRAFVVLTLYLILLGLFAWGVYQFQLNAASAYYGAAGFGGIEVPSVALSAQIGQSLFSGLLFIETLMVAVLAPAFTSGSISLEREKQTLDLLVATPLSSLALVVGKLASALAYVFLLILASVPLAAIVFLFGGVGPEDLVRGYVLLASVAIGYGAIGLFISALVKRTQVTTVLTYLTVLALTVGTTVLWVFMFATSGASQGLVDGSGNTITTASRPPQQLLWLNPFIADLDLICGTSTSGYDTTCTITSAVTGKPYFGNNFGGGVTDCPPGATCAVPAPILINGNGGGALCPEGVKCDFPVAVAPDVPITQQTITGLPRDIFWPQSTLAFLGTALILTLLSAQLVAPTHRRLRLPTLHRPRRRPAPEATA